MRDPTSNFNVCPICNKNRVVGDHTACMEGRLALGKTTKGKAKKKGGYERTTALNYFVKRFGD